MTWLIKIKLCHLFLVWGCVCHWKQLFLFMYQDGLFLESSTETLQKEMTTHSSIVGLENVMDRAAWQATVHGVARVRHDLAGKLPWERHRIDNYCCAGSRSFGCRGSQPSSLDKCVVSPMPSASCPLFRWSCDKDARKEENWLFKRNVGRRDTDSKWKARANLILIKFENLVIFNILFVLVQIANKRKNKATYRLFCPSSIYVELTEPRARGFTGVLFLFSRTVMDNVHCPDFTQSQWSVPGATCPGFKVMDSISFLLDFFSKPKHITRAAFLNRLYPFSLPPPQHITYLGYYLNHQKSPFGIWNCFVSSCKPVLHLC